MPKRVASAGAQTEVKKKKAPTKKAPTKAKLNAGNRVVSISAEAYVKFLLLHSMTSLEWSGYGPLVRNGDNGYKLLDFYYLSEDDSGGATTLTPEATAQAWMKIVDSGIDLNGVTLAWVHCHPFGGKFWSGTDDTAVRELTESLGPNEEQVSVLFAGAGSMLARVDRHGKQGESMKVSVDYGQYADDVAKAEANSKSYQEKQWAIAKQEDGRKGQITVLDGLPFPEAQQALPWFLRDDRWDDWQGTAWKRGLYYPFDDEDEDEDEVDWSEYYCEICKTHVTTNVKPRPCIQCGAYICSECRDNVFVNVCLACAIDVANVHNMTLATLGLVKGSCGLCGDPTEKGEMYCEDCRPLFEDDKGEIVRHC